MLIENRTTQEFRSMGLGPKFLVRVRAQTQARIKQADRDLKIMAAGHGQTVRPAGANRPGGMSLSEAEARLRRVKQRLKSASHSPSKGPATVAEAAARLQRLTGGRK